MSAKRPGGRPKPRTVDEMFEGVTVGTGASYHVGSDTYGYYVSEVDRDNATIGLYRPACRFTKCWEDGSMTADPFDPKHGTDVKYVAWRGRWWRLDESGIRTRETQSWHFGSCCNYRDPSF